MDLVSLKRFKNAKIIEAVDGVDALMTLSGSDRIDPLHLQSDPIVASDQDDRRIISV